MLSESLCIRTFLLNIAGDGEPSIGRSVQQPAAVILRVSIPYIPTYYYYYYYYYYYTRRKLKNTNNNEMSLLDAFSVGDTNITVDSFNDIYCSLYLYIYTYIGRYAHIGETRCFAVHIMLYHVCTLL